MAVMRPPFFLCNFLAENVGAGSARPVLCKKKNAVAFSLFCFPAQRKKLSDASCDGIEMGIDISLVFFNTTYP